MLLDLGVQAGVARAQVRDEERVLVVIAGAAEVGLAEDGNADGVVGHGIRSGVGH
jgi:hypothetical protein